MPSNKPTRQRGLTEARLNIRASRSDLALWRRAADRSPITFSDWVRVMLTFCAKHPELMKQALANSRTDKANGAHAE